MVPSYSAFDIVTSAAATEHGVEETAAVYFLLADRLQLGRLRDLIVALPRDDRWSSVARSALRDDLYAAHAALTRDVLAVGASGAGLTGAWAVAGRNRQRRGPGRRLGGAERGRRLPGGGDPRRDLGEQPVHLHHLVGGRPGDQDAGRPRLLRAVRSRRKLALRSPWSARVRTRRRRLGRRPWR